jgi:hypothetical protein
MGRKPSKRAFRLQKSFRSHIFAKISALGRIADISIETIER